MLRNWRCKVILASYMIIRVVIRIFTLLLPCISLSKNPLYFPTQNVYFPTQMIFMLHKVLYINM